MDYRYIVVDEPATGKDGDIYQTICPSAAEANGEASYMWDHLNNYEKKKRHIYAAIVHRDGLNECAADDDTGEIDWTCYNSLDSFPGAFDSAEVIV